VNKFTKLKHNWTLIDDGLREDIDAHYYRIVPPKWYSAFAISEYLGGRILDLEVQRAVEGIVDEILRNPSVKETVDAMINRARHEGYYGAYKEMQTGQRYEFEQSGP
jgi:hypothetical protein